MNTLPTYACHCTSDSKNAMRIIHIPIARTRTCARFRHAAGVRFKYIKHYYMHTFIYCIRVSCCFYLVEGGGGASVQSENMNTEHACAWSHMIVYVPNMPQCVTYTQRRRPAQPEIDGFNAHIENRERPANKRTCEYLYRTRHIKDCSR